MSAMPAETPEPQQEEEVVQLLIQGVPVSLRQRIKIAAARQGTTMQKLELTALRIGIEMLETQEGES